MARYIVKVQPRPTDRVYIKFSDSQEKQYLIQGDTTIELSETPKEITVRQERTWRRIFRSWRCMYVTITSLDSEKELYFPVFRGIDSAGLTIKEDSAKLPHDDTSEERKESLSKNRKFQETIHQHEK
ncbi:hypothetical protein COCON_G00234770, partial [Conger conger]